MAVGVACFSQTRGERILCAITVRAGELAIPGEAPKVFVLDSLVHGTAALVKAAETKDSAVTSMISLGWKQALPSPGGGTFPSPAVAPTKVFAPGRGGVDLRSERFGAGDGN